MKARLRQSGLRSKNTLDEKNLLVNLFEVLELLVNIRLDGLLTLLPVGGANLTMLLNELQSLNKTVKLIDVTTNGGIVHGDVADNALVIDDVGSTRVVTSIKKTVVSLTNVMGHISHKRNIQSTNTTLVLGDLSPSMLREDGINGANDNLSVDLLEVSSLVGESRNLSSTDKGGSKGIY